MDQELTIDDFRVTEADYLAGRSVADTYQARQLLVDWPSLSPAEQLHHAKALLTSTAMGNSVAEAIYRLVYRQEPYEGINWHPPSGEEMIALLSV